MSLRNKKLERIKVKKKKIKKINKKDKSKKLDGRIKKD